MRNLFKIKVHTLLYVFFILSISGLIQSISCYGQNKMAADVSYDMNLNSPELVGTVNALETFYHALCEGKVDVLAEMMDNNLQDEYRKSFDDPSYPTLLKELYGGSTLRIRKINAKGDNTIEVDAQIISQKSSPANVHFEIDKRLNKQSYIFKSFVINNSIN